jgi:hypothetical protein
MDRAAMSESRRAFIGIPPAMKRAAYSTWFDYVVGRGKANVHLKEAPWVNRRLGLE